MPEIRRRLDPDPSLPGERGLWIAILDEARRRTIESVQGLDADALAWKPPAGGNSIGRLLRHIALVELDWILTDLAGGEPLPADAPPMLRLEHPMADPGRLPPADFLDTLAFARAVTKDRLGRLAEADLAALRTFASGDVRKTFPVRWILHHIADHEAHHRGQIAAVKRMAGRA